MNDLYKLAKEVCKQFNITVEKEGEYLLLDGVGGVSIVPCDVEVKTLRGKKLLPGWSVSVTVVSHARYDEPEDVDVVEILQTRSYGSALAAAINAIRAEEVSQVFNGIGLAEMAADEHKARKTR